MKSSEEEQDDMDLEEISSAPIKSQNISFAPINLNPLALDKGKIRSRSIAFQTYQEKETMNLDQSSPVIKANTPNTSTQIRKDEDYFFSMYKEHTILEKNTEGKGKNRQFEELKQLQDHQSADIKISNQEPSYISFSREKIEKQKQKTLQKLQYNNLFYLKKSISDNGSANQNMLSKETPLFDPNSFENLLEHSKEEFKKNTYTWGGENQKNPICKRPKIKAAKNRDLAQQISSTFANSIQCFIGTKKVYYTVISHIQDQEYNKILQKYQKKTMTGDKSTQKKTLVIEIVGILFSIINPLNEGYKLSDKNQVQLQCSFPNGQILTVIYSCLHYLQTTIKYNATKLVNILRVLSSVAELVVYTSLPRSVCDEFFKKEPTLKEFFSNILCLEETKSTSNVLIKDIGLLLGNRILNQIIVIETDGSRVDNNSLTFGELPEYDGSDQYSSLEFLRQSLKDIEGK